MEGRRSSRFLGRKKSGEGGGASFGAASPSSSSSSSLGTDGVAGATSESRIATLVTDKLGPKLTEASRSDRDALVARLQTAMDDFVHRLETRSGGAKGGGEGDGSGSDESGKLPLRMELEKVEGRLKAAQASTSRTLTTRMEEHAAKIQNALRESVSAAAETAAVDPTEIRGALQAELKEALRPIREGMTKGVKRDDIVEGVGKVLRTEVDEMRGGIRSDIQVAVEGLQEHQGALETEQSRVLEKKVREIVAKGHDDVVSRFGRQLERIVGESEEKVVVGVMDVGKRVKEVRERVDGVREEVKRKIETAAIDVVEKVKEEVHVSSASLSSAIDGASKADREHLDDALADTVAAVMEHDSQLISSLEEKIHGIAGSLRLERDAIADAAAAAAMKHAMEPDPELDEAAMVTKIIRGMEARVLPLLIERRPAPTTRTPRLEVEEDSSSDEEEEDGEKEEREGGGESEGRKGMVKKARKAGPLRSLDSVMRVALKPLEEALKRGEGSSEDVKALLQPILETQAEIVQMIREERAVRIAKLEEEEGRRALETAVGMSDDASRSEDESEGDRIESHVRAALERQAAQTEDQLRDIISDSLTEHLPRLTMESTDPTTSSTTITGDPGVLEAQMKKLAVRFERAMERQIGHAVAALKRTVEDSQEAVLTGVAADGDKSRARMDDHLIQTRHDLWKSADNAAGVTRGAKEVILETIGDLVEATSEQAETLVSHIDSKVEELAGSSTDNTNTLRTALFLRIKAAEDATKESVGKVDANAALRSVEEMKQLDRVRDAIAKEAQSTRRIASEAAGTAAGAVETHILTTLRDMTEDNTNRILQATEESTTATHAALRELYSTLLKAKEDAGLGSADGKVDQVLDSVRALFLEEDGEDEEDGEGRGGGEEEPGRSPKKRPHMLRKLEEIHSMLCEIRDGGVDARVRRVDAGTPESERATPPHTIHVISSPSHPPPIPTRASPPAPKGGIGMFEDGEVLDEDELREIVERATAKQVERVMGSMREIATQLSSRPVMDAVEETRGMVQRVLEHQEAHRSDMEAIATDFANRVRTLLESSPTFSKVDSTQTLLERLDQLQKQAQRTQDGVDSISTSTLTTEASIRVVAPMLDAIRRYMQNETVSRLTSEEEASSVRNKLLEAVNMLLTKLEEAKEKEKEEGRREMVKEEGEEEDEVPTKKDDASPSRFSTFHSSPPTQPTTKRPQPKPATTHYDHHHHPIFSPASAADPRSPAPPAPHHPPAPPSPPLSTASSSLPPPSSPEDDEEGMVEGKEEDEGGRGDGEVDAGETSSPPTSPSPLPSLQALAERDLDQELKHLEQREADLRSSMQRTRSPPKPPPLPTTPTSVPEPVVVQAHARGEPGRTPTKPMSGEPGRAEVTRLRRRRKPSSDVSGVSPLSAPQRRSRGTLRSGTSTSPRARTGRSNSLIRKIRRYNASIDGPSGASFRSTQTSTSRSASVPHQRPRLVADPSLMDLLEQHIHPHTSTSPSHSMPSSTTPTRYSQIPREEPPLGPSPRAVPLPDEGGGTARVRPTGPHRASSTPRQRTRRSAAKTRRTVFDDPVPGLPLRVYHHRPRR